MASQQAGNNKLAGILGMGKGKGWGGGTGIETIEVRFPEALPVQRAFSTLRPYSKSGTLVTIVIQSTTSTIVTWVWPVLWYFSMVPCGAGELVALGPLIGPRSTPETVCT
jgi:hypothetical protein